MGDLGRWVAREMGGLWRWVAQGDGWLGSWVAKLVAPSCYGSSLGSNSDIFQEYKMGNISKGVANTL